MGILKMIFPSCKELAERLSRGEYEKSAWPVRLAVRWHLLRCELCDRYASQLRLVGKSYQRTIRERAAGDLTSLKKRLIERLRPQSGR